MTWLFGDFALDQERRQLLRAGTSLPLEPKAYELLSLLLARRPRALSKAQIRDVLWPGTFVSESALAGLVTDLRSAFGDDPRRPRFIRTVHGFGYAFCGEAREDGRPEVSPGPVLRALLLSRSGASRSFDRPFAALTAALEEPGGAGVHVVESLAGSRPPPLLEHLACLAQPGQVLLSRAAFDLARQAADGLSDGLVWLAHGPYLFDTLSEPIDVFEVGRPGQSFLRPPPDTKTVRRALRAGDETTLGWRPAPGLAVPGREGWTFLDKLGEGGFGEVWLAAHPSGERRVFKFCFDASRLRGLKREATLFQILRDELGDRDDIAKVLDWNFDEPPYFLESEYTEGGSLADWGHAVGGIGTVPLEIRLLLIAQVAEALAAAHSVGVLHKDVKPQNVLITENEEGKPKARLTDFGVGIVRDKSVLLGRDFTVTGFTEATGDANGSGTRLYAAPEVLEGRTPTTLADIYALGVMLYQIVVGDLEKALAPGWERDVADDLLKEDIGACVEGRPEKRLGNALLLAERLRGLKQRRAERGSRRRLVMRIAAATLGAGVAVAAFELGRTKAKSPSPLFQRLTFRRGGVDHARFAPDGRTVVYSAAWEGASRLQLFQTRTDGRGESRLDLPDADIAALSSQNELAILLGRPYGPPAGRPALTLARVPLIGGIPREVLANVQGADWSPDGHDLAVIHEADSKLLVDEWLGAMAPFQGHRRLEFPIGRVLYETDDPLLSPRVSPKGDRVAFLQRRPGLLFDISVVDLKGTRTVLSSGWNMISRSLAWSPDGSEVWFTADNYALGRIGGRAPTLRAVSLMGRDRLVLRLPEFLNLNDVSVDGRVLLSVGTMRSEVFCLRPGETRERDLSWHESSHLHGLSRDGQSVLVAERVEQMAYLRKTDGSLAVRLGEYAESLSPDGRWAVSCNRKPFDGQLTLIPTAAGESRRLEIPRIRIWRTAWFPDGQRVLLLGEEEGRAPRMWAVGLDGTRPRAITKEGTMCSEAISPDGKLMVCPGPKGATLLPVEGGEGVVPVRGWREDDRVYQWSGDGRFLYVGPSGASSAKVSRLELATGRREPWREITVADPAGVNNVILPHITPDGRAYAYEVWRLLDDLYVVEGLK